MKDTLIEDVRSIIKAITRSPLFMFISNAFKFRKELAQHSWWDYHYTLLMMRRSFIIMRQGLENKGIEVEEHRIPKIKKISRVIQILDNICESNYISMAEAELGELSSARLDEETAQEKAHSRRVYLRADEIENAEWSELWDILKGQDKSEFVSQKKTFEEWFDGSDMRSWWD